MSTQTEVKHTPTPLAVAIYQAMGIYKAAFGESMHGTHPQIAAMLELGPMKPIASAVNCHKELLELAKSLHNHLGKSNGRKIGCADCETITKAESR